MPDSNNNEQARRRPTTADIVAATIAAAVGFLLALFKISSYDVWWHMALGRRIIEDRVIGGNDPFSYTFADRVYPHSDWLFDALLYLGQIALGFSGLPVAKALLFGLLAGLIVLWITRRGLPWSDALWISILISLLIRYRLFLRPHLTSILLFTALLFILETSKRKPAWLIAVPPMLLLWSNLHDGVIFGLILGGLYFTASLIQKTVLKDKSAHRLLPLAAAFIIGFGLTFINPSPGQYLSHVFASARPDLGPYPESEPLVIKGHMLLILSFGLAALLLSWKLKSQPVLPLLLLLPFAAAGIKHGRLGVYFALICIVSLPPLLRGWREMLPGSARIAVAALAWGTLIILGAEDIRAERQLYPFGTGIATQRVPVDATRFLVENTKGRPLKVYNTYEFGGYLDWALPENAKVFWDGRTRFNLDFVYSVIMAESDELFSKLRPDVALIALPRGSTATWFVQDQYFLESPQWEPVYFDDVAIVLAPLKSGVSDLIPRFGYQALKPHFRSLEYLRPILTDPQGRAVVDREIKRAIDSAPHNSIARLNRAQLIAMDGDLEKALEQAREITDQDKDFYEAHEVLGSLLLKTDQPKHALRIFKKAALLAPELASAQNNLGVAYLRNGYIDKARRAFIKAHELNPQMPEPLYNLAKIAEMQRDEQLAQEYLNKVPHTGEH